MNKAIWNGNEIEQMNHTILNGLKEEYMDIKVPDRGLAEMQKRIADAKRDKRKEGIPEKLKEQKLGAM